MNSTNQSLKPITTEINSNGNLQIGGCDLVELAQKYFALMQQNRLMFNGWKYVGGTTLSMDFVGCDDEIVGLRTIVHPAIEGFLTWLKSGDLLPQPGEEYGKIIMPYGEVIPLSL